MIILTFLLTFSGSIGFSYGRYAPQLGQLNSWLIKTSNSKIHSNYLISLRGKINAGPFSLCGGASFFKGRTFDNLQSLLVIPLDIKLGYRLWLLPALLSFYTKSGYEWCFVEYDTKSSPKANNWGGGIPLEVGINFIVVPDVSFDFWGGYKFTNANGLKFNDGDLLKDGNGNVIPIELWGLTFGITFRREF
ncbi:hypothetical protein KAW65_01860 [candidate division WOR-3 bacterium]|nr:hypothetical protein [candidate division WOR-3 bacterium]